MRVESRLMFIITMAATNKIRSESILIPMYRHENTVKSNRIQITETAGGHARKFRTKFNQKFKSV